MIVKDFVPGPGTKSFVIMETPPETRGQLASPERELVIQGHLETSMR